MSFSEYRNARYRHEERIGRSVHRELYRPQGDVTPEAACSPENGLIEDGEVLNGAEPNTDKTDMIVIQRGSVRSSGVTGRGMRREYRFEDKRGPIHSDVK